MIVTQIAYGVCAGIEYDGTRVMLCALVPLVIDLVEVGVLFFCNRVGFRP